MGEVLIDVVVFNAEGCEISRHMVKDKDDLKRYMVELVDYLEIGDTVKLEEY